MVTAARVGLDEGDDVASGLILTYGLYEYDGNTYVGMVAGIWEGNTDRTVGVIRDAVGASDIRVVGVGVMNPLPSVTGAVEGIALCPLLHSPIKFQA